MAFNLYQSNSLKVLAAFFEKAVYQNAPAKTALEAFTPCRIIVQSKGMAMWIKQYLAQHAICMNTEFPFLTNFINTQLEKSLNLSETKILSENEVRQKIYVELLRDPENYGPIAHYLDTHNRELKCWQLAEQLANLFDQYQAYSPEDTLKWIHETEAQDTRWQSRLYRTIFADTTPRDRCIAQFEPTKEPERAVINIFGVSSMPPLYLSFFKKLSATWEVNFFYLNPCYENWSTATRLRGDFGQQIEKLMARYPMSPLIAEKQIIPENPILNNCGKLGADFLKYMIDFLNQPETVSAFVKSTRDTLLATFQHEITSATYPTDPIERPRDDSISIHNCHSARREVEELYNQLIRLFVTSKEPLEPRDIIVMAPDIQKYESLIDGVFGAPNSPFLRCYSIADRTLQSNGRISELLLSLFKLAQSRFKINEVMAFFESEEVYPQFDFEAPNLAWIREKLQKAEIRWGENEAMRARLFDTPFDYYSWDYGFKRILFGLALHPDTPIPDDLPFLPDGIFNSNDEKLGCFLDFTEKLFKITKRICAGPRPLSDWAKLTHEILNTFFIDTEKTQSEIQMIRNTIEEIPIPNDYTEYPLEVVSAMYNRGFRNAGGGGNFLRGKITFCSMMPMRSIPMKVVAILGLNYGEFPRKNTLPNFNLITKDKKPLRYFRTPQAEDRFLFLEALLSAENDLLLFYQGRTAKNAQIRPPAVPLGEVIDYVQARFGIQQCMHKLQGFAPAYFQSIKAHPLLCSYTRYAYDIAKKRQESQAQTPPAPPLYTGCATPMESTEVTLDSIIHALKNPIETHIRWVAGIRTPRENKTVLTDDEPTSLAPLASYNITQEIAQMTYHDKREAESQFSRLQHDCALPISPIGDLAFQKIYTEINDIDSDFKTHFQTAVPQSFHAEFQQLSIDAEIPIAANGNIYYTRFAKFKYGDAITAWTRHLFVNALASAPSTTYLLFKKDDEFKIETYAPLSKEKAQKHLHQLLEIYLEIYKSPIPFFGLDSFNLTQKGTFKYENAVPYAELCFPQIKSTLNEADLIRFKNYADVIFYPYTVNGLCEIQGKVSKK